MGFLSDLGDRLYASGNPDPRQALANIQAQQVEAGQDATTGGNYLTNPAGVISAVSQIPGELSATLALRNDQQQQAAQTATVQQQQDAQRQAAFGQVVSALRGAHAAGADVGQVYDQIAPTLAQHGASPADLAAWKPLLTGPNGPAVLEAMDQKRQDALDKIIAIPGNGGGIYDPRAAQATGNGVVAATAGKPTITPAGSLFIPGTPAIGGAPNAPGAVAAPVGGATLTNNGGAIKDGKFAQSQPGYAGVDNNGFAKFTTPGAGILAQEALLKGPQYLGGGNNTVAGIVNTYLGAGPENSAASKANYIQYVAGKLGVDPNAPIPNALVRPLGAAMRGFENVSGGQAAPATASTVPGAPPGSILNPKATQVRPATPQEVATAGYPAGTAAQVDENGKFLNIKSPTGKPVVDPTTQYQSAKDGIDELRNNLLALKNDPGLGAATGLEGMITRSIPGTHAQSLESQLGQIQAQKLVDLISTMKQSGNGAFSRVTNQLAKFLPQVLAPLSFHQNVGDFKANIDKGVAQLGNIEKRLDQGYQSTVGRAGALPPPVTGAAGNFKPGPNGILMWSPQ